MAHGLEKPADQVRAQPHQAGVADADNVVALQAMKECVQGLTNLRSIVLLQNSLQKRAKANNAQRGKGGEHQGEIAGEREAGDEEGKEARKRNPREEKKGGGSHCSNIPGSDGPASTGSEFEFGRKIISVGLTCP